MGINKVINLIKEIGGRRMNVAMNSKLFVEV